MSEIDAVYSTALGHGSAPFLYQRRIAEEGLPEVLNAATGCGKTPAVMLGWTYRRFRHPDPGVRQATPSRLIWCLPLRTLTDQTAKLARTWIHRLGLDDQVDVHLLMGGERVPDQQWRLNPAKPAIIVSTLDMALSRALNRGYLASRYAWPVDFALFNDDCHWVFDEVQLMGVALTTSRQLHGLRSKLGVPSRHCSTWMSATIDLASMSTVDAPEVESTVALGEADRSDATLATRLAAPKIFVQRRIEDRSKFAKSVAGVVQSEHVAGSTTLVVLNTVKAAQDVARLLRKGTFVDDTDVVLLHSRFRSADRESAMARVLEGPANGRGLVVVSTQVIEAGVDLSSQTLVTECAPWSSIVQRSGRCNRWGELSNARVVVVDSSGRGPYDDAAVEAAWATGGQIHLSEVTPDTLAAMGTTEDSDPLLVLRRKDLLDLFDTAPDLAGNDVDVSRFIRADGDLDVSVAWRTFPDGGVADLGPRPSRAERCAVPIGAARDWFKTITGHAAIFDPLMAQWRLARADDLRPGIELLVDAESGGYSPETGFDPTIKKLVEPVEVEDGGSGDKPGLDDDRDSGDDPLTTEVAVAVELARHLVDAEDAAERLCDELNLADGSFRDGICLAARLHDLGKAHPVFQAALHERSPSAAADAVLAKSGTSGRLSIPEDRKGFRHELVSALVLDAHPQVAAGGGCDPDLVTYLVAAHHGRTRLSIRSLDGEPEGQMQGVREGDHVDRVELGGGVVAPATTIDLTAASLGGSHPGRSWAARAERLLAEHGPFRLAWMEAVVRIADWRASIEGGGR